ncbi:MAG: pilus assembly protein [Acidimicrobiia bacterium]|nr:pilus assembly protein [Acidimicrobiia bacterium]MDH3398933.1 pilus assembly protein [Acidimicrobiia bacterium]MDH5616789.1 pilus assembly protein [Acidimicrobiia bacterium]
MRSGTSKRPGRFFSHDRGAALMEAALVMPLMLMLTVGVWTTARAWNVHSTLDHAAREAARYGATEVPWDATSAPKVRAVADQELQASAIAPADVTTVCIGRGSAPCGLGAIPDVDQVAVQLSWDNYQMDFIFFSVTVDLRASAVSRWEG